jgi:hypothetical protein
MFTAARSFTLPDGFMYSALPKMLQPVASESDLMRTWVEKREIEAVERGVTVRFTSGVLPTMPTKPSENVGLLSAVPAVAEISSARFCSLKAGFVATKKERAAVVAAAPRVATRKMEGIMCVQILLKSPVLLFNRFLACVAPAARIPPQLSQTATSSQLRYSSLSSSSSSSCAAASMTRPQTGS